MSLLEGGGSFCFHQSKTSRASAVFESIVVSQKGLKLFLALGALKSDFLISRFHHLGGSRRMRM